MYACVYVMLCTYVYVMSEFYVVSLLGYARMCLDVCCEVVYVCMYVIVCMYVCIVCVCVM